MRVEDFYNHYCGECHHWYPCATEKEGGACDEQCRPCSADETACGRLWIERKYNPNKEETK